MGFAIAFINTTTFRTLSRRVPWVYKDHWNTGKYRFVEDKLTELMERPTMQIDTLRLPKPYPLANSLEVLKSNRPICVFSLLHNLLTDAVVLLSSKATFFTRQSFCNSFSRLGSFLLKSFALSASALSNRIDLVSCELFTIRSCGDVDNSQVNSKAIFNVIRRWFVNVASGKQIESTVNQNKVAFAPLRLKQFLLSFATNKGHSLSALDSPNGNSLIFHFPRKNTSIIGYRSGWIKRAFNLFIQLVSVGNFSNRPNNHLSRKRVFFASDVFIDKMVNIKLFEGLSIPCTLTDMITSCISNSDGVHQKVKLFLGWLKFDLCRKFHNMIVSQSSGEYKYCPTDNSLSLPIAKARGISRRNR